MESLMHAKIALARSERIVVTFCSSVDAPIRTTKSKVETHEYTVGVTGLVLIGRIARTTHPAEGSSTKTHYGVIFRPSQ